MSKALTDERIRNAAKHLESDSRRLHSEFANHSLLFKLVAEDAESENDSASVAKLRQGLLEVIDCSNRLEYHSQALHDVSQSFEAGPELTDFSKVLDESTRSLLAANPSDSTQDILVHQFDRAVWNIHHAGEAAPGQEQEEIVMITAQSGILNKTCPLSGKPVVSLEDPVYSKECHHIYDQGTILEYIVKAGRRKCKCPAAGCPKFVQKDFLVCDTKLKMEIQELRLRERRATQTQVADYTEVDPDE